MTRTGLALLWSGLVILSGCSTSQAPPPNSDSVRRHADKAFQQLHAEEQPQSQTDQPPQTESHTQSAAPSDLPPAQASSEKGGVQIPLAEIRPFDDGYVRATGYGSLSKGLYLCQHSADLAARVELSKLIRVKTTERSTDRIRERTGKETEQDIEIAREGLVNEVLSEVRMMDRTVDKETGTCSSTAVIPKKNLIPASTGAGVSPPQSQ